MTLFSNILFIGLSLFIAVLGFISYKDLKTGEISPITVYALIIISLFVGLCAVIIANKIWMNVLMAIVFGGLVFFIAGYIIFLFGGFGGGDVKLLGAIGGFLGLINHLGFSFQAVVLEGYITIQQSYFIMYIINIGTLSLPYSIIYILYFHRKQRDRLIQMILTKEIMKFPVPFAPIICLSFILMFL